MTVGEWALVASVVFTGLWSGLFAMLNLVMHPMLKAMNGYDFARFLRAFLPTARRAPFNYVAVIGMVVAPIVALVALGGDPSATPFVLTAIGLGLTAAGPLLVSNRLAEPNYDVMLAWDPVQMPADWEAGRRRYFALNWVRALATWEPSQSSWERLLCSSYSRVRWAPCSRPAQRGTSGSRTRPWRPRPPRRRRA
jgi:hypothetical protein